MSDTNETAFDEAVEQCTRCGETVLSVYIEDGLCYECQE